MFATAPCGLKTTEPAFPKPSSPSFLIDSGGARALDRCPVRVSVWPSWPRWPAKPAVPPVSALPTRWVEPRSPSHYLPTHYPKKSNETASRPPSPRSSTRPITPNRSVTFCNSRRIIGSGHRSDRSRLSLPPVHNDDRASGRLHDDNPYDHGAQRSPHDDGARWSPDDHAPRVFNNHDRLAPTHHGARHGDDHVPHECIGSVSWLLVSRALHRLGHERNARRR